MGEQGRLVSWAEAAELLAGMEAFLAEVEGRPLVPVRQQSWVEVAGVVEELRGEFD